jgi:hypothetical protein
MKKSEKQRVRFGASGRDLSLQQRLLTLPLSARLTILNEMLGL